MKLTPAKVQHIKAALSETKGRDQIGIAKRFKVSRSTISDIFTERSHKDVPWPEGYEPVPLPQKGQRKKLPSHNPTDSRVMELESEIVHLSEELRHERAKVKAGAKSRGLFKAIIQEMDKRIVPLKPAPRVVKIPSAGKITEHVVMHLSDMHADQIVVPDECGGLEQYNFPIACARAERYVDTVIDWTQNTLKNFHFPVLTILSYGDHTSGEIHGHVQRSYYRNQFKNSLAVGQLQAMMIRDLAPHFAEINVICVAGNHGRRTAKKDHHGAHDNWDYLIAETAKLYCRDLDNVTFTIPNAWSINVIINDVGFNVSHGDDVRGWNGIPFYGMVRKQKGLIALGAVRGGQRIRYYVMGHHHVSASLADIDGELMVNGAWVGTDAYAYNEFAGYREPCQWLHGVNPEYGITWRMDVKLKRQDEHRGPSRYLIDGGRDVGPLGV